MLLCQAHNAVHCVSYAGFAIPCYCQVHNAMHCVSYVGFAIPCYCVRRTMPFTVLAMLDLLSHVIVRCTMPCTMLAMLGLLSNITVSGVQCLALCVQKGPPSGADKVKKGGSYQCTKVSITHSHVSAIIRPAVASSTL